MTILVVIDLQYLVFDGRHQHWNITHKLQLRPPIPIRRLTVGYTSCRSWDHKEQCCRTGQAIDGSITRRMRFACWITKATDTHSEHVILTALPLQKWLHERAFMLRYTYVACPVHDYRWFCRFALVTCLPYLHDVLLQFWCMLVPVSPV